MPENPHRGSCAASQPLRCPDHLEVLNIGGAGVKRHTGRRVKELFYIAPDARLMAVSIAPAADGRSVDVGTPVPLFTTRLATTGMNVLPAIGSKPQYAVAPDGRFLMNVPVDGGTIPPITIAVGWDHTVRR